MTQPADQLRIFNIIEMTNSALLNADSLRGQYLSKHHQMRDFRKNFSSNTNSKSQYLAFHFDDSQHPPNLFQLLYNKAPGDF